MQGKRLLEIQVPTHSLNLQDDESQCITEDANKSGSNTPYSPKPEKMRKVAGAGMVPSTETSWAERSKHAYVYAQYILAFPNNILVRAEKE